MNKTELGIPLPKCGSVEVIYRLIKESEVALCLHSEDSSLIKNLLLTPTVYQ